VSASAREVRLPLRQAPAEGEIRLLRLNGRSVGLFRVDGDLHALADRCPHRGAPLCAGRVATPV
jgi:phenylpropionate dioxygenase-like ring-hydroxylating dioxygenase large terminal subunit